MNKLQNYTLGQWTSGAGEGTPLIDAVTGEIITFVITLLKIYKYSK